MHNRLSALLLITMAALRWLNGSQRGQTGMEIALIGVVCSSCVLGGVVIATSDEAVEQLESVFHAGLDQASGTLIVTGSVIATASGDPPSVDSLVLTLGTIGKPTPITLDSSSEDERLVVGFLSETAFDNDVPYSAMELRGDGDGILEPGETAEIRISILDIADGTLSIGPMQDWTLQISAPSGGDIQVSRTMPFTLQSVNSLH